MQIEDIYLQQINTANKLIYYNQLFDDNLFIYSVSYVIIQAYSIFNKLTSISHICVLDFILVSSSGIKQDSNTKDKRDKNTMNHKCLMMNTKQILKYYKGLLSCHYFTQYNERFQEMKLILKLNTNFEFISLTITTEIFREQYVMLISDSNSVLLLYLM